MLAFCGSRLSPRMAELKSGALVCLGVPIARTGVQTYRPDELGITSASRLVKVLRPAEEVFSPAAVASFEGVAVTDQHPGQFVSPTNWSAYGKGHIQNIREGAPLPSGERVLVGDLVIHDGVLKSKIRSGMQRDISCGYDATYVDNGDGSYTQTEIRGNHVACVEAGRANVGRTRSDIRILDEAGNPAEDFAAKMRSYHRAPILTVRPEQPGLLQSSMHGHIEGAIQMDGEIILEGPRALTIAELEAKFDAIVTEVERREAASEARRARKPGRISHEAKVAHLQADQFDRRLHAEFYGDASIEQFAAKANAAGRKMRRLTEPVALSRQAADSQEHWAEQLNRAGREMRGR